MKTSAIFAIFLLLKTILNMLSPITKNSLF